MADEKKKSSSDSWAKVEPVAVGFGTWSWLIALAAAIVSAIQGIVNVSPTYTPWGPIPASNWAIGIGIWNFIQAGVTVVIIFIYVLKPFSVKCKAKEWDSILGEKTKMWVMAIILAVFSYWGCAGVIIPAIMLTFVRK
ncbi:MAG: hypothetical protein JW839_15020 [Candidatus Lokiarchaeota archaeon]|nr:hypothetical protein [Candidatus Lokiarchaeota archaeon]